MCSGTWKCHLVGKITPSCSVKGRGKGCFLSHAKGTEESYEQHEAPVSSFPPFFSLGLALTNVFLARQKLLFDGFCQKWSFDK
jgi:hypothetical protein